VTINLLEIFYYIYQPFLCDNNQGQPMPASLPRYDIPRFTKTEHNKKTFNLGGLMINMGGQYA